MRMFKKLIFVCCCSMFLQGCVEKETDLAKQSQVYAWSLATDSPKDTVTSLFATMFAQEVERLSEGTMKIKVYENGTLGSDRELIESCLGGDIPFVVQSTSPQANFMPELSVFDTPIVFDTIDGLRETIDEPLFYNQISDVYERYGFHLLGFGDQGFRIMSTNRKITSIDDFQGLKIRTMENPYHLAFWKAIDANPTPMTFSEVYIGLQQGTIVAQENPYEVIVSGKLYEQQDYVVNTNHLPHMLSLITNNEFYKQLTPQQQEIIATAANTAQQYARQQADERIQNRLDIILDSGTQMIDISDEVKEQMLEASAGIYDDIRTSCGDALFDAYTKR